MRPVARGIVARLSPTGAGERAVTDVLSLPLMGGLVLETGWSRIRSPFHPTHQRPDDGAVPQAPEARGPEAWMRRARNFGVQAAAGSDTLGAALVLLAGLELGQNVERIARRTGLARPFVSKCARRLIDNGVWSAGTTVARWIADPGASDAFVQDVAVAEGRLLRRIGAGGKMEWAVAGAWNKNFESIDSAEDSLNVTYTDAPKRNAEPVPLAFERESTPAPSNSTQPSVPITAARELDAGPLTTSIPPAAAPAESVADAEPRLPETAEVPAGQEEAEEADTPSLEQVFSNAVWLR